MTPEMFSAAITSLQKQLCEISDKVATATHPPIYGELKTVTKLFGYSSSQRMKLFIDTALEGGHKIRMIKPKASRYDTSARVHYHIGDIEKAFAYAQ